MTKRIFTYGCSVTQHIWPTWADIVLHSARISGYSVFNAGLSGIGNTGIKRSLIQTHEKYRITEEDLLLIMWSSFLREDRITNFHSHENPIKQRHTNRTIEFRLTQSGNVLNSNFYTDEFIRDYFNIEHYIINSISEISIVRKAFNLLFEGHFSIGEGLKNAIWKGRLRDKESPALEDMLLHDSILPNLWNIGTTHYRDDSTGYGPYYKCDGHPVPAEALEYVINYVAPYLPFPIHKETLIWVNSWSILLLEQIRLHSEGIGLNKHHWEPIFVEKMNRYNEANGVNTSREIWGGSDEDQYAVDVEGILKTFIKNSAENS